MRFIISLCFDFFFYDWQNDKSDKARDHGANNKKDGVLWVGSGLLSFVYDRPIVIIIIVIKLFKVAVETIVLMSSRFSVRRSTFGYEFI